MIRIKMKCLFVFVLCFFSSVLYSQTRLTYELYDQSNGLSQSIINSIFIDDEGFMWVGTQHGLNKFDGIEFEKFFHSSDDAMSLTHSFITSIVQDASGSIWVGTKYGLNKYNKNNHTFTHFGLSDDQIVFPENDIRAMFVDSENFIWVLLSSYLVKLNPISLETEFYSINLPKISLLYCKSSRFIENENNIKFIIGNRLYTFDKILKQVQYKEFKEFKRTCIRDFIEYNGDVYLCKLGALYRVANTGLELIRKFPKNKRRILFAKNNSSTILISGNNIYKFTPKGLTNLYWIDYGHVNFVPKASHLDNNNILWLGISGKGVVKINLNIPKFNIIIGESNESNKFSNEQISSVFYDNGAYFVGTYGYGLNLIKPNGYIKHYSYREHSIIKGGTIYDIEKYKKTFFIATSSGITNVKFNTKGDLELTNKYRDLNSKTSYSLHIFNDSVLYYTQNGSLIKYNLITKKQKKYLFNIAETKRITFHCMKIVGNKYIYLGTNDGLIRLNILDETWDKYFHSNLDSTTIREGNVLDFDIDNNACLWIATTSGLDYVSAPLKNSINFSHFDNMQDHIIYSVIVNKNYLFAGTDNGLFRYNFKDSVVNVFHKSDGLPCEEFNSGVKYKLGNNRVILGGQGGVVQFNFDSIQISNFKPNVRFTKAVFYSKKGERVNKEFSSHEIKIKSSDLMLKLYFTSLDLSAPEKILYRYKINESDWIYSKNQNYISFTKLEPGKYNITVGATNSDRIWSPYTDSLTLIVPKPWYLSLWAIGVGVFIIVIIILIIINARTRSLRLTNQVLKEREVASKKIADQKNKLALLNQDLTQSMRYAERIQNSFFSNEYDLKKIFKESFVYFNPKEIIGGDFFWVNKIDDKIIIAAVDCTGHGIPGALMSVISLDILKRIVIDNNCLRPADILLSLDDEVSKIFKVDSKSVINVGMDISICVLDANAKFLEFSGALNSLYHVKNGTLFEIKADRIPIGMANTIDNFQYTNYIIEFSDDDLFYMFSDGYIDQFGGVDGKKYKTQRFKNFLSLISSKELDLQQVLLDNNFNKWRANNDQLDDVLVIGFKPVFSFEQ